MKRNLLFCLAVVVAGTVIGQPVLSFENHRLLPGADNPMTLCKYMNPGSGGAEMVWDFSDIEATNDFVGRIVSSYNEQEFEKANTRLVEFTTSFFFDISESGIKQVGYASQDNKTQVKYEQPFEKLRFPFSFEENYSSNFSGIYLFNNRQIGEVAGNGFVEADAWGELKLPNNKVYSNTIRIKTTKNYTITSSLTSSSTVEIVTYRWYNNQHRYPLLVLTEFTTNSGGNDRVNYQAAYNNNAVSGALIKNEIALEDNVVFYPNPSEDELYMSIRSSDNNPVFISFYDISGKVVLNEQQTDVHAGQNKVDLSAELSALKAGTYMVRVRKGEQSIIKELSVSNK